MDESGNIPPSTSFQEIQRAFRVEMRDLRVYHCKKGGIFRDPRPSVKGELRKLFRKKPSKQQMEHQLMVKKIDRMCRFWIEILSRLKTSSEMISSDEIRVPESVEKMLDIESEEDLITFSSAQKSEVISSEVSESNQEEEDDDDGKTDAMNVTDDRVVQLEIGIQTAREMLQSSRKMSSKGTETTADVEIQKNWLRTHDDGQPRTVPLSESKSPKSQSMLCCLTKNPSPEDILEAKPKDVDQMITPSQQITARCPTKVTTTSSLILVEDMAVRDSSDTHQQNAPTTKVITVIPEKSRRTVPKQDPNLNDQDTGVKSKQDGTICKKVARILSDSNINNESDDAYVLNLKTQQNALLSELAFMQKATDVFELEISEHDVETDMLKNIIRIKENEIECLTKKLYSYLPSRKLETENKKLRKQKN